MTQDYFACLEMNSIWFYLLKGDGRQAPASLNEQLQGLIQLAQLEHGNRYSHRPQDVDGAGTEAGRRISCARVGASHCIRPCSRNVLMQRPAAIPFTLFKIYQNKLHAQYLASSPVTTFLKAYV